MLTQRVSKVPMERVVFRSAKSRNYVKQNLVESVISRSEIQH